MEPKSKRNVCRTCGMQFALKASLKAHELKHEGSSNTDVSSTEASEFTSYFLPEYSNVQTASTDSSVVGYVQSLSHQHVVDGSAMNFQLPENVATSARFDSAYESALSSVSPRPVYECVTCNRSFDALIKLEQHNKSDGHARNCNAVESDGESSFKTNSTYGDSILGTSMIYRCKRCVRSFDDETKLKQHKASEGHKAKTKAKAIGLHKKNSASSITPITEPLRCAYPDCGKTFDQLMKLHQHQLMKNHAVKEGTWTWTEPSPIEIPPELPTTEPTSLTIDPATENLFSCNAPDCNRAFPTSDRLIQHQKDKHAYQPPLIIEGENVSPPQRKLCTECDDFNKTAEAKSFIFLTFVAKHILREHPPKKLIQGSCPICFHKVEKTKNMLAHIARVHLLSKYPDEACFICLRLCKDKNDLQQHTTSVHRFKCLMEECNSMFPSKDLRDKHMLQKHAVYVCGREDCQKIFASTEERAQHMNVPHPVDSDSDTSVRKVFRMDPHQFRPNVDTGVFSEPLPFRASEQPENLPFSADEQHAMAIRRVFHNKQSLYAAHRRLQRHLLHTRSELQDTLPDLLHQPVEPTTAQETALLCQEVIAQLNEVLRSIHDDVLAARLKAS